MAVIECKNCGAVIDDSWAVCPDCGAAPGMGSSEAVVKPDDGVARCAACGEELVDGANFCGECGSPVRTSIPPAGEAPVVADEARATLHLRWKGSPDDSSLLDDRVAAHSSDPNWCGVYLDGRRVGRVLRGRGVAVRITPGRHSLAIGFTGSTSKARRVDAEPGGDLFFECGYGDQVSTAALGVLDVAADILLETPFAAGSHLSSRSAFWLTPVRRPPTDA